MLFLTLEVKRSDQVICGQSIIFEATDVMKSYSFVLHLTIIEVTIGGLESRLIYEIAYIVAEGN